MKTKAAVVREASKLTIEEIELDPPKTDEVLVRMQAAGVCHSDLHTYRGELRTKPPLVLGHEGAGIVEKVGSNVTSVKPGDRIMVNWLPSCNACTMCLKGHANLCERFATTTFAGRLLDETSRIKTQDGITLKHYLSASTMSEYMVISEPSAIKIPDDVPFDVASVIGCAVATGVGAVVNTARVSPGDAAAVIGCGGIGLSMLQGCQLAGCHPIIAVDVMETKLAFARKLGASHTINAREKDVVETLRAMIPNGPDYVFDSVGSNITIPQALQAVRPGGAAVVVGLHAALTSVPVPAATLILQNKQLLGSFVGSIQPKLDLPKLVELYRAGKLQLDQLITKRYSLDELSEAFADMEAGSIARGVITFEN